MTSSLGKEEYKTWAKIKRNFWSALRPQLRSCEIPLCQAVCKTHSAREPHTEKACGVGREKQEKQQFPNASREISVISRNWMLSLSPCPALCYLFCHDLHGLMLVSRYGIRRVQKVHYRCCFCCENISSSVNQKWWPCCMLWGQAFPPSWKKCLSEGWLNEMPAHLQNGSCQPSAKWGEEVEPQFEKSYAHPRGPSEISAPYMAGNSVWVEAVRDDLILAECSLTPLRVPEWSWGQGLCDCWLLALPQLWEQQLVPM